MIVSAHGFEVAKRMAHLMLGPSRIAAQVVSGVGFLGAGSILHRGNTVRGMITAASIWAVAALGLAAGAGLYAAAAIATVIILVILAGLKPLEEVYRARVQSCVIRAVAERGALSEKQIRKLLRVRGGQVRRMLVTPVQTDQAAWTLHLTRVSQADLRVGGGACGWFQVSSPLR
ncbi:MgtC/SapB family protein [Sphingomonas sp. RRHST34]|uniref:Protein MgtC n=1 Tax=Sphingomonas citri TaxID=2862499 RepID=A0ABS7BLD3_9SPHN|nr:MgtC/SapB family protein [Sphingomonas citri]MBW6530333.1 MgtC/SapB family protein [Sphingomonas citri]